MSDIKKLLARIGTARDAISRKEEQTSLDYMIDGVLMNCSVMLKEQETVEPILKREGRNKYYNDYVCPCCDNEAVYEQNYCSECGVRFLWERAVK